MHLLIATSPPGRRRKYECLTCALSEATRTDAMGHRTHRTDRTEMARQQGKPWRLWVLCPTYPQMPTYPPVRRRNMNTADDLVDYLNLICATIEPVGDRLILKAG